jgi:hypothetical protein
MFLPAIILAAPVGAAEAPSTSLITKSVVEDVKGWLSVPVVRLSIEAKNKMAGSFGQADIDALDKQWRAERKTDDQPLITAILSSPLSSYLLRIQAASLGLYSEIFVMDANGLNVGQSAITSDYWQGDEAKFQKTYGVGAGSVFVDEPEFNEETATWRAQLNLTIADEKGAKIGAATVELNLTELQRRSAAGR